MRHVPDPSLPVTPDILRTVLAQLDTSQPSRALTLALLLMFIGFLRQSLVAPQTVPAFDHTRHLTVADVLDTPPGLLIAIKWTKSIQSSADATSILIPPTQDTLLCPVRALRQYTLGATPPRSAEAPLIRHQDGNPLTVPYIRRQWNRLLAQANFPPGRYSLHGLRRGAAQFTYNESRADVMNHGTWRSQAVRSYIAPAQTPSNTVYRPLIVLRPKGVLGK